MEKIEKYFSRLELCKQQIKSAKASLFFWSHELKMVSDALADLAQGHFDFQLQEDRGDHNS